MSTLIIQVEEALGTLLNSENAPCFFDRAYPGEYTENQLPAANLIPTGWQPDDSESDDDSVAIHAEWAVALRAYSGGLTVPGSAAIDPLVAWVWQQLYADQTLGGMVRELSVSKGAYHYDRTGNVDLVHCQIDIVAQFDVRRGDLTANYNVRG